MRPVEKGAAPRAYTAYHDAAGDLRAVIGDYCSYCERRIETHLAVEHIQPKSRRPTLATAWRNLLFGCVNCNSTKGKKRVSQKSHYWPDRDNTMRAFAYVAGGLVQPDPSLSPVAAQRALATIALTGLDKFPGNPGRQPTDADQRWLRRQQARDLADRCVKMLAANDSAEVRALIVEAALGRGMFSVWWTAFAGDEDMRRRLRQAFVGTCPNSFDASENLRARPGGQL